MLSASLAMLMTLLSTASVRADDTRPPFRQRLDPATYHAQLEQILAQHPAVAQLEASPYPMAGFEVRSIIEASFAAQHGITAGNVLISVNGVPLWESEEAWNDRRSTRRLALVTTAGERRTLSVPPGLIGVWHTPYTRPDLYHVRQGQRAASHDRHVLAATWTFRREPDFAETAMAHALRAGYQPDEFSDALGALIALYQGRPGVADAFVQRVVEPSLVHPYHPNAETRARIALALGHYEQLAQLAERDPQGVAEPGAFSRILGLWRQQGEPEPPAPHAVGEGMERVPLPKDAWGSIDDQYLSRDLLYDDQFSPPYRLSRPQGHFGATLYGVYRPVRDVEVVFRFRLSAERRTQRWGNLLEIRLVDWQYRQRHGIDPEQHDGLALRNLQTMLGVALERGQWGETMPVIYTGGEPDRFLYEEPAISLDPSDATTHIVRFTRVGNWGRIMLDDVPLALLPVEADARHPAIHLFLVGATVEIESLHFYELTGVRE